MRLFIAVELQDAVRETLISFQNELRAAGVRGNYTPEENLHLTLAFIGEYGDPEAVLQAMEEVSFGSFALETDGTGMFSDILWAGLSGEKKLDKLVRDLRASLAEAGIPFDKKRFRPHITLLRRVSFSDSGNPMPEIDRVQMSVQGITLFRSDRGKHGMIYTPVGYAEACDQGSSDPGKI